MKATNKKFFGEIVNANSAGERLINFSYKNIKILNSTSTSPAVIDNNFVNIKNYKRFLQFVLNFNMGFIK